MSLIPGLVALHERTVADDDTAIAMGSGDVPVLATPRIVAWAEAACAPEYIHPDGGGLVAYGAWPRDWEIRWHDFEDVEQRPRRKRGTTTVRDTAGLLAYIDLQEGPWDEGNAPLPTIYYQAQRLDPFVPARAVAVFNGHTSSGPGWGDHRAVQDGFGIALPMGRRG